jgi:hypothetical protein
MRLPVLAAALSLLAAPVALAQPAACPLPYKVFETAVPHLDMEACPASVDGKGAFCRVTLGHDAMHVFAFTESGDQCLRSVTSFETGKFSLGFR